MATIYISDKIIALLVRKDENPKEYIKTLLENDFKHKGWKHER